MSGLFITFEGIDGCGKSTQLLKAARFFTDLGYTVIQTKEPGGTLIGRHLRSLLLEEGAKSSRSEVLLFLLDRAEHVRQVIQPAIEEGKVVLCDRFTDSTLAYQLDYDFEELKSLNNFATGGMKPHLTLYFDLPLEVALGRRTQRSFADHIESRPKEYMQNVLDRFLQIAAEEPNRIKLIPAQGSMEQVTRAMETHLRGFIESNF